jgi:DNA-binding transcriptional LysR family regulator
MIRDLLAHLPVVMAVARRGGFAAAGTHLGLSPSAVSHAVRVVENELGMPLFVRTTRSVALTEAGSEFIASIGPALIAIGEAGERARSDKGRVTGTLRLSAQRAALSTVLTPVVTELTRRHPDLLVEISAEDGPVDLIGGGFDARIRLGEVMADDIIAARLTQPFQAIMVATPAYLEAFGEPMSVADLSDHNCIRLRDATGGAAVDWDVNDGGKEIAISVTGTVMAADQPYARDLALAGIGIAHVFAPLVHGDLQANRLVWVMPEAAVLKPGLFLVFARSLSEQPKLRAFIDVARDVLRSNVQRVPPKTSVFGMAAG